MGIEYRPPCPSCGAPRMWKVKNSPRLKCPECGTGARLRNPRLRIRRGTWLADLRGKMA